MRLMAVVTAVLLAASFVASATPTVRPEVQEAFALAEGMKMAIADYASHHNSFPSNNAEAMLPDASMIQGLYVVRSTVSPSQIEFEFGPEADASIQSKHLILSGVLQNDRTIQWACQANLPQAACPDDCSCSP